MPENPEQPGEQPPPRSPAPSWGVIALYVAAGVLVLALWQSAFGELGQRTIPYSEFKAHLARGEVERCLVKEEAIEGRIVPNAAREVGLDEFGEVAVPAAASVGADEAGKPFNFTTVRVDDPQLVEQLAAAGVEFSGSHPGPFTRFALVWMLPLGLLMLLWLFLMRGAGTAGQTVMSFGKSRAKLVADRDVGVTFADVAGCDEAKDELREIVEFLRDPDRFKALGARIPKGVLVVGPPGTGKTLIARAVAGEAAVPFFSLSGSDFVEMFVGVGAARVRDLFHQATVVAPCIVFIDELDAIGRQRGVHVGNINDERENTLNQLLVEMDGFDPNVGVILLAATNRPDVLDPALLRPGRFDRQVVIDSPDAVGREAILRVHTRGKPLATDVDLCVAARSTPGFSGADLANAVNEAALLAARTGERSITQECLEEAIEKVVAGPERRSRRLGELEKRRVAYHEVGHAIVAAHCKHADPVHKISIVPRGRAALGYTLQLPTGDRNLMSRSELFDRLTGLLGGRAAEEVIFAEVSTGAENDLEQATAVARQAVCQYGMGESAGLMHCAHRGGGILGEVGGAVQRDCSEETAHAIDLEVKSILEQAYADGKAILTQHRDQLERVAAALMERETIDQSEFQRLLAGVPPEAPKGVSPR
jgi:cell division protease FtsH